MNQKIYFKGLNGLRFFAATLVLFWHSNRIVAPSGVSYNPIWHFISQNGTNAVSFFFVLSGFLISYLLITEYEQSGTVVVKRFYYKRVLRIWPLYYLIVILVQLILPSIFHFFGKPYQQLSNISTFFFMVILPNVPYALAMGISKIGHLWSIGVEEQFYLIWAPIVKLVKRHIVTICAIIVVVKLILSITLFSNEANYTSGLVLGAIALLKNFAIEKMAIGGVGAYFIYYYKERLMASFIFTTFMQLVLLGLLAFFMSFSDTLFPESLIGKVYYYLFRHSFSGVVFVPVLFLYLIINTSLNKKSIIRTENRWLNYLGEISFGLYMYHMISIYVVEALMPKFHLEQGTVLFAALFFLLAIGLNLILSSLSYRYFESKFLRFRPKD